MTAASPELVDRVRAIFREAPFVAHLGIEPTHVEPGRCETALVLRPQLLQHTGQAHAGVVTTLADHTAGAAAQSMIPDGAGLAITAELKVSLLRPARGERLVCRAHVLKPGRQLMFTQADVFAVEAGREQLVATLSATMAVVAPR